MRSRLRTRQEARAWRRKVLGYVLFGAAFVLMVNAFVGENGYLATMQARSEHERLTDELARKRFKNQKMLVDIDRLKHDASAIDDAARRELNMIKPGEIQIIIREPQPPK